MPLSAASPMLRTSGTEPLRAEQTAPRLLIVDDIADNRHLLSRRFRQRGFATVEASHGHTA